MDDDYTEDDKWDWDRNDPSQYCRHGTFIGSWWGPDILCGACEMGEPEPDPTDECPEHGEQVIKSWETVGDKGDPYAANVLACGHKVVCMGPGEPNVII